MVARPGNGSQWPKMGLELMSSSAVFPASIKACAKALQPFGVDLLDAFSAEDGFLFPQLGAVGLCALQVRALHPQISSQSACSPPSVAHPLVGGPWCSSWLFRTFCNLCPPTDMQVGLTDMLREKYGIVPVGFLGHSAGEMACAYADGGFTREQVKPSKRLYVTVHDPMQLLLLDIHPLYMLVLLQRTPLHLTRILKLPHIFQAVLVAYHRARLWPQKGFVWRPYGRYSSEHGGCGRALAGRGPDQLCGGL